MKKIYISGKITGLEESEAFKNFEAAEKKLKAEGFEVVNPLKLEHNHNKSLESYMKEDIKALIECEGIYVLENYLESLGAQIELRLAQDLGLAVRYENVMKDY